MKEQYGKSELEALEANSIFHQFFTQGVKLEYIQEKNQLDRLRALQNSFNKYIYLRGRNNELNSLRRVMVRNRSLEQADRDEYTAITSSKASNRSNTSPRKENSRF